MKVRRNPASCFCFVSLLRSYLVSKKMLIVYEGGLRMPILCEELSVQPVLSKNVTSTRPTQKHSPNFIN